MFCLSGEDLQLLFKLTSNTCPCIVYLPMTSEMLMLCSSGEKLWQLPLEDDYVELFKSPIADMNNVGGRFAGAITAALFLRKYVDTDKV